MSLNFTLQGRYDRYECGLEITDAQAEDQGDWSCEMETYVKGGRKGDGFTAKVTRVERDL